MNNKVDLMIIGAQKAGTTSLNNYLAQHPNIYTHFSLEFNMFRSNEDYNKGIDFYYNQTISDAVKSDKNKIKFIAKRVGLMHDKGMLLKLKEHNPDIKIVIVLRNPSERAYSAFIYGRKTGREPLENFNDAILDNQKNPNRFMGEIYQQLACDYVGRSLYYQSIKDIYEIFPKENVSIFLFEQIKSDYNKYLNIMSSTLGLSHYHFDTTILHNSASEVKSKYIAKLLSPGHFNKIKNILPLKYRIKIKQTLNSKNIQAKEKKTLPIEAHNSLLVLFREDVNKLNSILNLPLHLYWPEYF